MKYYTSTALLLDNQNQLDLSCISDAVLKEREEERKKERKREREFIGSRFERKELIRCVARKKKLQTRLERCDYPLQRDIFIKRLT